VGESHAAVRAPWKRGRLGLLFLVVAAAAAGSTIFILLPALEWAALGLLLAALLAATGPDWRPVRELGRSLLPLAFPLALYVLILLLSSSPPVQAAAALVGGLLTFAYLAGSLPHLVDVGPVWFLVLAAAAVLVALFVFGVLAAVTVVVLVHVGAANVVRGVGRLGGAETLLEDAALLAVVVAALLRLWAFATSPLRRLFVLAADLAVIGGLLSLGAPASIGSVFESAAWRNGIAAVLLAAAAATLVAESRLVQELANGHGRRLADPSVPEFAAGAGRAGLRATHVSALCIVSALIVSLVDVGVGGSTFRLIPTGYRTPRATVFAVPHALHGALTSAQQRALAAEFAPALEYDPSEQWAPTTVDSFAAGAKLTSTWGRTVTLRSLAELKTKTCPKGAAVPCYALYMACGTDGTCKSTEGCDDGRDACARGTAQPWRRGTVVYARVLTRGSPPADGSPRVFDRRTPYGSRLAFLIEYWLFYDYDEWKRVTPAGVLTQLHQGDWEAVTIGLSTTRPLFVALTAHCGGRWYDWSRVHGTYGGSHVWIGVAKGSHANYVNAEGRRASDWASCRKRTGFASVLSYISNVRDTTGRNFAGLPRVRVVDARELPMSFPGIWGGFGELRLTTGFRSRRIGSSPGPVTPTYQALWQNPLSTIFCSPSWRPRACGSSG